MIYLYPFVLYKFYIYKICQKLQYKINMAQTQQGNKFNLSQQYTNLSLHVRKLFYRHFNLYHKVNLTKKTQCYLNKQSPKGISNPEQYYECMQKLENEMIKDSRNLQLSFSRLEQQDRECQQTCKTTFEIEQKRNDCIVRCFGKYRESTINLYNKFYEQSLGQEGEYKKLKR